LGPSQLSVQLITEDVSSIIRRPERESDNTPPSSVNVSKTWRCTSIFSYIFKAQMVRRGSNAILIVRLREKVAAFEEHEDARHITNLLLLLLLL
jgi:hypothetical protein